MTLYLEQGVTAGIYIFGIVGLGLLLFWGYIFSRIYEASSSENSSPLPEDAPWKVRPAWRTNELTEDTSFHWKKTIGAIVWNLLAWPGAVFIIDQIFWNTPSTQWETGERILPFLLIFGLIGIGIFLGWIAIKPVLHQWKFGTSILVMETMPARLGHRLQALLRSKISLEEMPDEGYHVQLSCYHRYIRVTTDSDGNRKRKVRKNLKWRDEKRVRGTYSSKKEWDTEVPFSFELPIDPPPSTPRKKEERIMWELNVSAELEGLDYDVSFEIPVFEPDEAPPSSREPIADGDTDRSEEVFWDTGEKAAGGGSLQREHTTDTSRNPYATHEVGTDFTKPVSDGIDMEGRPGRGLTFTFAPGRSKGQASFMTILGIGLLVGGYFAFSVSVLFGLILLLFGGLISFGAWQKWTESSTITVEDGSIKVRSGSLGLGSPKRLPCSELEDVQVAAEGGGKGTTYYTLRLVPATPEEFASTKAKQILEWTQGDGQDDSEEVQSKFQDVLEKSATTIRVASDLKNKQEADWIADQILEAADREASFQ